MGRIKEWEELTIRDNFMFQKVMQGNRRLCKRLIERLLHIDIKHITYPEAEKSVNVSATQRSVRLDLYVETDDGTILDIEMQAADGADGWLPRRMRYYQAMIDLSVLGKGRDYIELKTSYVIFICAFDPFGEGRRIYTFRNRCVEREGLELGDDTTKIFLNARGTAGEVHEDIARFLAYVDGRAAEGEFAKDIAREVERVRQHKETRLEYMTLMMELKQQRREGYDEGVADGEARGIVMSIKNLMKTTGMTVQDAMKALMIPASEWTKYTSLI